MAVIQQEAQQAQLKKYFSNEYNVTSLMQFGGIAALTSQQNLAALPNRISIVENDRTNKRRKFRGIYEKQGLIADVQGNFVDFCGNCTPTSTFSVDFDTMFQFKKCKTITQDELQRMSQPDDEFFGSMMEAEMNAIYQKMNTDVLGELALNLGVYADGLATKNFTFITGGNLDYINGEAAMLYETRLLSFQRPPLIIGAGNIALYTDSVIKKGGAQTTSGFNFGAATRDYTLFFDTFVNAIVVGVGNKAILLGAGVAQIITYNYSAGIYAKPWNGNFSEFTIVDPRTSLTFDMQLKYDDCAKDYKMILSLSYGVAQMPKGIYPTAHPISTNPTQVNGTLTFTN